MLVAHKEEERNLEKGNARRRGKRILLLPEAYGVGRPFLGKQVISLAHAS